MQIHRLTQGSPEWLAYRAKMRNASDAPAMMGCSPYKTRAQLLRELHTGIAPEVDAGTQKRFDNGHRVETLARPLAEELIGAELYPVTGSLGNLSASFDGLTMDETTAFEHKALNDDLRAAFDALDAAQHEIDATAANRLLPLMYRVQMEQQLLVSGAERVLFTTSAWTAEDDLIEERHCWYYSDAVLRQQIVDGWAQFDRDLAAYAPPAAADPAPVGKAPDTLPALRIELTGQVTASNLAEFKQTALAAIRGVNRNLRTDADFADAEKAVKWCADVEARLKAAKEHALSQTASIDELFRTLDEIAAESKAARLDLDKLVTRRKTEVKEDAVTAARRALEIHIDAVNAEVAPMRLQMTAASVDFAGAIKGKRLIDSVQDALDTLLASAKITADAQGRAIRANVQTFRERAAGMEALFADLGQLVHKAADDFTAAVDQRIAKHRADEAERARQAEESRARQIAQAEERARQQERERIEAEQSEQAAQQRRERDSQAQAATVLQQLPEAVKAGAIEPERAERIGGLVASIAADSVIQAAKSAASEPATLKLGVICERLGFTVSAAFLADVLHIRAAETAGRAVLYRESQWPAICSQLQAHIGAMSELYGQRRAA